MHIMTGLTETQIADLYRGATADGALRAAAYDLTPQSLSPPLFAWFVRAAAQGGGYFGALYDGPWAAGFFYLTDVTATTAHAHFCLFRPYRRRRLEAGRLALRHCFRRLGLAGLTGLVPSWNRAARAFATDLGGEELAAIPRACYLARRDEFTEGRLFLFREGGRHGRVR